MDDCDIIQDIQGAAVLIFRVVGASASGSGYVGRTGRMTMQMVDFTVHDEKKLTVMEATDYSRQSTPMLRIRGLWLQELGFVAGYSVVIHCEEGKLIVTKETILGGTE